MSNEKINYYRGNPKLLTGGEKLDYTKEQIDEIIKCSEDYEYFIYNYVYIKTHKGLEKPEVRQYQQRMLETIHSDNRVLIMAGRQCGKSASIAMYLAWYLCFHSHKTVGIVANKEKVAKLMLNTVKNIFINFPLFLKPGVDQWGMTEIKLDNGSVGVVSACSADALTGYSLNVCVVDEVSKIAKNKANDFFDSVLPTVEADPDAKVICCSTPKGLNLWYKMWKEAERGISGYSTVFVEWNEVPGRDEEWREKKIAEKGLEYFNQEFSCMFHGSSSTLVDGAKIKSLPILRPIKQEYENKFNIYELPNKDHHYILICDVCEGVGKDYSVIQVIDYSGETYKQVAVFRDNTIKPFSFHLVIDKIGRYYNEALVMIERNSCGAEVADNLMYDLDYPNMYYGDDLGIRTTKKTKSLGCSNLAFLIETDKLLICDYETINELSKFVYDGKTFKAQDYDDHDDLIMPLVLFAWLAMDKVEADLWLESTYVDEINKEKQEEVDEFLVLMDYSDC